MSRSNYDEILPMISKTPNVNKLFIEGFLIIFIFFGGFLFWSLTTKIEAAAVAEGKIVVEGKTLTIEHLEGGIIKRLFVKDGSSINQGEPLLELDQTQEQARLKILERELFELIVLQARIEAELQSNKKINLIKLSSIKSNQLNKILKVQQAILTANLNAYQSQIEILKYKIKQLHDETTSLNAQVKATKSQSGFIEEEILSYQALQEQHLIEKPKILALQREKARLLGNYGEFLGSIAKVKQQVAETKLQIVNLQQQTKKQLLDELSKIQKQISQTISQQTAIKDIIHRMIIRSPKAGVVVGLIKHTIGAVIKPGQEILSIVPNHSKMIIEARISPLDVDVVHKGLKARVTLTAYKQRNLPSLIGVVSMISADALQDKKTGEDYYLAKITNFDKQLVKYKQIKLYPGMPAQIMIITDVRSPFDYLLSPLLESVNRSFREQ